MDTIYLKIASCIVRINFHPFYLKYARNEIIERINFLYKGFVIEKNNEPIDMTINFYHSHTLKNKVNKKTGEVFFFVYQRIKKDTINAIYTMSIYQFQGLLYDNLLRILTKKGILVLHASASKINGKAYIFLGNSGAGKSTTINLLQEAFTPLADDNVYIKEENDGFTFYQTPFYEKSWKIKKKNTQYPLGGVFFLHKSKNYTIKQEVNENRISTLVLKQLISEKFHSKTYLKQTLSLILKYKNFYHLYFGKDSKKLIELLKVFN